MTKMQREYFLREQLKAIQKELGESDEQEAEIQEFEHRIAAAGMPEEAEKEARRELDRMRKMPTQAAEYSVIKTYLDWMVSLPWKVTTDDNLDIAHARQVLDEDHYGLEKIKERILEFLAVRKLRMERRAEDGGDGETGIVEQKDLIRREREGVILCFVGPPGTGKTSLGRSDRARDGPQVHPACRWAASAMRRKSAASAAPTSARCRAASSRACAGPRATTPSSCWTRWTSWATTSGAIRRRRCWRCSTRSRTSSSAITTWTCRSI